MAAREYALSHLRVEYMAREVHELEKTLRDLQHVLKLGKIEHSLPAAFPLRQARRMWKATTIGTCFTPGWRKKHFVFAEYRYAVDFYHIRDPRPLIAAILGSRAPQTFLDCHFTWEHRPSPLKKKTPKELLRAFMVRRKMQADLDAKDITRYHTPSKWPRIASGGG